MNSLFFSLLCLSVDSINDLSRQPSSDEWLELYRMSIRQSVVGICFAGVRKYAEIAQQRGEKLNIPSKLYYQWLGTAVHIQRRNELINQMIEYALENMDDTQK